MFCAPTALVACAPTVVGERNPKAFAKGLLLDYHICAYKQAILAQCIKDYESKAN